MNDHIETSVPEKTKPPELESLSRAVLDGMGEGFILLDRQFRVVEINGEGLKIDGRPRQEIVGRHLLEVWPESEQLPTWPAYQEAFATGVPVAIEYRHESAAHDVWLEVRAYPIDDSLAVFYRDISGRKKTEELLRISRDQAVRHAAERDTILSQLSEGVIVTDEKGCISFVNAAAEALHGVTMLGVPPEEYADRYSLMTMDGAPFPSAQLPLTRAVRGETVADARWRVRRPDGSEVLAIGSARPILMDDGQQHGAVLTVRDDTQRSTSEEALQRTGRRLDAILNNTLMAVFLMDHNQQCIYANAAAEQLTGYGFSDMQGRPLHDVVHHKKPDGSHYPLEECPIDRAFPERAQMQGEELFVAPDGSFYPVAFTASPLLDEHGRPIGTVIEARNISVENARDAALHELTENLERRVSEAIADRERVEEALRQSQKMEAVGQLTGGIAHDFNNLLTVVTGNIDMALRGLASAGLAEGRLKRSLDNAMKGADRAAALTQRLLAFSRRQPLDPKPLNVDRLVADMSDLLNRALGETIRLEVMTSPGLWRVEADPNQLESAILNLAVNARDAMPRGGTLTIETANARLDDEYAAEHAEVAPGLYVVIAVTDTGVGMSRETAARVFEPFFTTKEVGRGTGLGLSQVYGFTKQSGGHVKIYSEEGQGTTVKIYLPRLFSEMESEVDEVLVERSRETSRGRETIMVVEDDDDVRAYTVDCLRELGYQVLEAHDGPSALRLLERQDAPIDLLFTDVVMPGLTGRELADEARKLQPDLRVLYTSGYTRDSIVHGGRLDEGVEMINKPFTCQQVGERLADMLEIGRTGRLLLVGDDATVRMFAADALTDAGYAIDAAASTAEALGRVRAARGRYDAVVLDSRTPDRPGEGLVAELRALHADMPILIATGDQAKRLAEQFAGDRCIIVIAKPYNAAALIGALHALGVRCQEK